MPRRQTRTAGLEDSDMYSRDEDSATTTSSRRAARRRDLDSEGSSAIHTPSSEALPVRLAVYGDGHDDATGAAPPRDTFTAAPPSELHSVTTATNTRARPRRGMAAAGEPFPGVSSVANQQQQQQHQQQRYGAEASRRSSLTTSAAVGQTETTRVVEARRHHRRFLELCGKRPAKRAAPAGATSTRDSAVGSSLGTTANTALANNTSVSDSEPVDVALGLRYGNGTHGVKERQEEAARQRAHVRKAEREQAATRSRRVSVFDRLVRRPSMRLVREDSDGASERRADTGFALPQVYAASPSHGEAEGSRAASPYAAGGGGGGAAVSLPAIRGPQASTSTAAYSEMGRRGRSAPLVTMDPQDTSSHTAPSEQGAATEGRTMRPVQQATRFESGGIVDAFGYFPNHRTNAEYYAKIQQAQAARQTRTLEVNRETGAVSAASNKSKTLLTVPSMAETHVEQRGTRQARSGRRAPSKAGGTGPRTRSSSRLDAQRSRRGSHSHSRSPQTPQTPQSQLPPAQPVQQSSSPYRFYTVTEDGGVCGFDLGSSPSAALSARTSPSASLAMSPARSPPPRHVSAATGSGQAAATTGAEPAWLADGEVSAETTSPTRAFAVRVSEANPYEDHYGRVVQTLVYPVESAALGAGEAQTNLSGNTLNTRSRGASLASFGRDRWGEPLAPPPQTTTVVVRRYTNDNGNKPVRLHIPPGTSLQDLHGKDEFPSVSLPWL